MTSTCMVNCMTGVCRSHTILTTLNVVFIVKQRSYEMTFCSRYQVGKQRTKYAVCHTAKTIQFSACQCTQVANSRNHNSYNGQCTDLNSLNHTSHGPSEVNNNYLCILQE